MSEVIAIGLLVIGGANWVYTLFFEPVKKRHVRHEQVSRREAQGTRRRAAFPLA